MVLDMIRYVRSVGWQGVCRFVLYRVRCYFEKNLQCLQLARVLLSETWSWKGRELLAEVPDQKIAKNNLQALSSASMSARLATTSNHWKLLQKNHSKSRAARAKRLSRDLLRFIDVKTAWWHGPCFVCFCSYNFQALKAQFYETWQLAVATEECTIPCYSCSKNVARFLHVEPAFWTVCQVNTMRFKKELAKKKESYELLKACSWRSCFQHPRTRELHWEVHILSFDEWIVNSEW